MTAMITNRTFETDSPVHAPDYHAEITAGKIFEIAERTYPERIVAVRSLRKAVEQVLVDHHTSVHNDESDHLTTRGIEHANSDLDSERHDDSCQSIYAAVLKAVSGTEFEHIFAREDVRAAVIADLHHETRSQMHVHRITFKERGGKHYTGSNKVSATH